MPIPIDELGVSKGSLKDRIRAAVVDGSIQGGIAYDEHEIIAIATGHDPATMNTVMMMYIEVRNDTGKILRELAGEGVLRIIEDDLFTYYARPEDTSP